MPDPGRWARADVQANPAVECEAPRGWGVEPFTVRWGLRTSQMNDDVIQAGLYVVCGPSPG